MRPKTTHGAEMTLLGIIAVGIILILLVVVSGLFISGGKSLPNWAENVLISISTALALKIGDLVAAVIALASGRQIENFGTKLASSSPTMPAPQDAIDAANQVAQSADQEAERIARQRPDDPEKE